MRESVPGKLLRKSINGPYCFERLIGKFLLRLDKYDTDYCRSLVPGTERAGERIKGILEFS